MGPAMNMGHRRGVVASTKTSGQSVQRDPSPRRSLCTDMCSDVIAFVSVVQRKKQLGNGML